MYKALTIEEIVQRPEAGSLGNLETMTMFYDPVGDEIILNSDHKMYDTCQKLVERYLTADADHREKAKNRLKYLKKELALLDRVIEIRWSHSREEQVQKLKEQYAKEFKMIGNQTAFWKHLDLINAIEVVEENSMFALTYAFNWGYIQGIKAERAKRKKVSL